MKVFWVVFVLITISVFTIPGKAQADSVRRMLADSWDHYKKHMIIAETGRPLADIDTLDIAQGSKGQRLTFSETVSYVLFRAVLIGDKRTFDTCWTWARNNLQRRNIPHVYHWHSRSWGAVPEEKKDHLFAWRYTPNIANSGKDGIIYYSWTPSEDGKLWRDGLDVAPDGDQLIAGALILAHIRWKNTTPNMHYRAEAKDIIIDLWEKTVRELVPGEIYFSALNMQEWFSYHSPGNGNITFSELREGINVYVRDYQYAGIGKVMNIRDIKRYGPLRVSLKGYGNFRVILEDAKKRKWHSLFFSVNRPDMFTDYTVLIPDTHIGCDFSRIKVLMLEFTSGSYDLLKLTMNIPQGTGSGPRYHLFSNDKNMPWINISYYMPFLYRIFAELDTSHPWNTFVQDAYKDIQGSMKARLSSDRREWFQGKGILVPNWFAFDEAGEIIDLPWAADEYIDDYMAGWDAFRTWFFLAADKRWHRSQEPEQYLHGPTYTFLKEQLDTWGYLRVGYTISGDIKNVNWTDQNSAGPNGAYLAFFQQSNDIPSTKKIMRTLIKQYDPQGFWEDKHEYYKQNWAWLGLALYSGLGDELFRDCGANIAREE